MLLQLISHNKNKKKQKSGNFIIGPGKIASIMRLSNYWCNVVSGKKHGVLFWIIWIGFLLFILLFLN